MLLPKRISTPEKLYRPFLLCIPQAALFQSESHGFSHTGGAGLKETLDYLSKLEVWGFGPLTKLGAIYPPWPASKGLKIKNKKKIAGSTEEFYKKLKDQKHPSPGFNQYMHFRFMRMTSDMRNIYLLITRFIKIKRSFFIQLKLILSRRVLHHS